MGLSIMAVTDYKHTHTHTGEKNKKIQEKEHSIRLGFILIFSQRNRFFNNLKQNHSKNVTFFHEKEIM